MKCPQVIALSLALIGCSPAVQGDAGGSGPPGPPGVPGAPGAFDVYDDEGKKLGALLGYSIAPNGSNDLCCDMLTVISDDGSISSWGSGGTRVLPVFTRPSYISSDCRTGPIAQLGNGSALGGNMTIPGTTYSDVRDESTTVFTLDDSEVLPAPQVFFAFVDGECQQFTTRDGARFFSLSSIPTPSAKGPLRIVPR